LHISVIQRSGGASSAQDQEQEIPSYTAEGQNQAAITGIRGTAEEQSARGSRQVGTDR